MHRDIEREPRKQMVSLLSNLPSLLPLQLVEVNTVKKIPSFASLPYFLLKLPCLFVRSYINKLDLVDLIQF